MSPELRAKPEASVPIIYGKRSELMQRTVWLVENDLVQCVHAYADGWDTHNFNTRLQVMQGELMLLNFYGRATCMVFLYCVLITLNLQADDALDKAQFIQAAHQQF